MEAVCVLEGGQNVKGTIKFCKTVGLPNDL